MLENPGGLVYGTIVVAALLDAESASRETYPETVAAVAVALVMYWLAHSYADFAGHRLGQRETLNPRDLGRALFAGLALLAGAAVPLLVLVLSWATGASLTTAVNIGIYTAAAMLLLIEVLAAWRADLAGLRLAVQSLVGAALGALVIALKLVFH